VLHHDEAPALRFVDPRPKTIISLTPLIDVVFILLLFFMLATNFDTETAFAVSAAKGSSSPSISGSSGELRQLDERTFTLDGTILDEAAMRQQLRRQFARDPSYSVSVGVATGIDVQSLLELIALTKQIGIQRITIESRLSAANQ